jgi:hypothetical protein
LQAIDRFLNALDCKASGAHIGFENCLKIAETNCETYFQAIRYLEQSVDIHRATFAAFQARNDGLRHPHKLPELGLG